MFGLIETTGGRHKLAPLGRMVVDPLQERDAWAKAFLTVPLYKALYENHKTGVLPPAAALERDMVSLGVAEKQKERARQVFERSAEQAGFFEHVKNRLVMPAVAVREESEKSQPDSDDADGEKGKKGNGAGDGGGLGHLDPLLIALLKKVPATKDDWPAAQRVRWFKTFAMNVSHVYDDADNPVDMKIELETVK